MDFVKQVMNSLFSYPSSSQQYSTCNSNNNPGMNVAAHKIKGYLDLAIGEIDKAVRADELGLVDGAVLHYENAQQILVEASIIPVPPYISSGQHDKVNSLREKISKWQGNVSDRLLVLSDRVLVLSRRTGGNSIKKAQSKSVIRTSSSKTVASQISSGPSGHNFSITSDTKEVTAPKPAQNNGDEGNLVGVIESMIVDRSLSVKWEDIAGHQKAKQSLLEMVIQPMKRKDLFIGLRMPPRGLLLFGPPGTGKTMLAKAVASESNATFFDVSASKITSKWVGESEKLVRTLFMVANSRKPSVIFIDEIDSILSARTSSENEGSRRLKSEFLVQFDGVTSNSDDPVVVIGATNKPHELDDAVLRRLVKRIYIPLPDASVRRILLKHKLKGQAFYLPSGDIERLVKETEGKITIYISLFDETMEERTRFVDTLDIVLQLSTPHGLHDLMHIMCLLLGVMATFIGYSGSELVALCKEAAMMPMRELGSKIEKVRANQVRSLKYSDFTSARAVIRPSLQKSMEELDQWNRNFGSNYI